MQALGDATYLYTHQVSGKAHQPQEDLGVQSKTAAIAAAFDIGVAQQEGVALAREWANRPANHATPTMLANVAKGIAKAARMS